MPRKQSVTIARIAPKGPLWDATTKGTLAALVPLLGTGFSYAAYADDLGVSQWPWRIGLLVSLLCAVLPIIVVFSFGRKNLLWVYGVIAAFPLFGAYYLLGIVFCFYYLLFAPLPAIVHWSALVGGILLTLYWMAMSWQTVSHTIAATTFVTRAFTETAADFQYQPQSAMALFERLHKERLPFPKIYMYIVLGIGPFGLLLERLLSSSFGTGGVLFLLAVLSMPLSLWFAGVLVRAYLVMVRLPLRLQREHGKPVLVS